MDFNADVQIRKDIPVKTISGAIFENFHIHESSLRAICSGTHSAAVTSMDAERLQEIFPIFDSGCSTVLTDSMLNCRNCEELIIDISQAENGAIMRSTHKCKKTYYIAARDGDIHAIEFDAFIVPSLKCDLIGGRAVTNGLDFKVILDKDANISEIHPRLNGMLCGIEYSIRFF